MINATSQQLAEAGITGEIDVVLADPGYWASDQIENLAAAGIQPLVPPDSSTRKRKPGANRNGPRYDFMHRVIKSEAGHALYRQRKHAIEPQPKGKPSPPAPTTFTRQPLLSHFPHG